MATFLPSRPKSLHTRLSVPEALRHCHYFDGRSKVWGLIAPVLLGCYYHQPTEPMNNKER